MPPLLNDALSVLLTLGTLGAVVYMYRRHKTNQAVLRGKRQIDPE